MRGGINLGLSLAILAAACGGETNPVIEIAIQTPSGERPIDGLDAITVRVQQGEADVVESMGIVSVEGFGVEVAIADLVQPVDLSVELTGPSMQLIGGAPTFIPSETGLAGEPTGLVVVPVSAPATCGIVEGVTIVQARSGAAVSLQGTFVSVLGGVGAAGPSVAASFLDLLRLGHAEDAALDDLAGPLGPAVAAPYDTTHALVLSALESPFVFDITGLCPDNISRGCPTEGAPAGLHPGVGPASTIIRLRGDDGALVVGGDGDGASTASFIDEDGAAARVDLLAPRVRPAVFELISGDILVAGGEPDGAPFAELVRRDQPVGRVAVAARVGSARTGAALFSDATGAAALLVGGLDATDAVVADTVLFTGCPGACTAAVGPAWPVPRAGALFAARPAGGGIIAGGQGPVSTVEEVVVDATSARFAPHGPLGAPRASATPLVLPNGLVYVVGGDGEGGVARSDVEVCFPPSMALP